MEKEGGDLQERGLVQAFQKKKRAGTKGAREGNPAKFRQNHCGVGGLAHTTLLVLLLSELARRLSQPVVRGLCRERLWMRACSRPSGSRPRLQRSVVCLLQPSDHLRPFRILSLCRPSFQELASHASEVLRVTQVSCGTAYRRGPRWCCRGANG